MMRYLVTRFTTILAGVIMAIVLVVFISSPTLAAESCSDVAAPLPQHIVSGVTRNKAAYVQVSNQTNVPWEILAAIHYRETNFSRVNPSNGQGIFQFVNGEGGPYPYTGQEASEQEFMRQLAFMANKLQTDYVYRGNLSRPKRPMTKDEADMVLLKDTMLSYNGRASVYAQQAAQYGYDPSTQPYEGSPYVMNMFDCQRRRMGMITRDFGSLDGIDTRYGTFTLFSKLRNEYLWQVIKAPNDGRYFLQVGNTKRWIPSTDMYNDWTLNQYPVITVQQSYFDSIPTIPELTRLGTEGNYNYVVDGGRKHYLPVNVAINWGYASTVTAPIGSLLSTLPEQEPMKRFLKSTDSSNTTLWVMDNGSKRPISAGDAAHWGYNPAAHLTALVPGHINAIPTGAGIGTAVIIHGLNYAVDGGGIVRMPNVNTQSDWGLTGFSTIHPSTATLFPPGQVATVLVRASNSGAWFMIEGGRKHYVPNGAIASSWGLQAMNLTVITPDLLTRFSNATDLGLIARDSSNQKVYVLDGGTRHHVPNGTVLDTWLPQDKTAVDVPNFSPQSFTRLSEQAPVSFIIKDSANMYVVINGRRYYVPSGAMLAAWGNPSVVPTFNVSTALTSQLPDSGTISNLITNGTANYVLDNASRRPIPAELSAQWGTANALTVDSAIADLFTAGSAVTGSIKINNSLYLLDAGKALPLGNLNEAFGVSSTTATSLTTNSFTAQAPVSYIAKSTNTADQTVWLVTGGKKHAFTSFASYVGFGYISRGVPITSLSPEALAALPTNNTTPGLFIRKASSYGVKMLDFGGAWGFADGDSLSRHIGSNEVLVVSDAIYDAFPLRGAVSKLVQDDQGKIYLMENGRKRWITNGNAYAPYRSLSVTYLFGTTMAQIPTGPSID